MPANQKNDKHSDTIPSLKTSQKRIQLWRVPFCKIIFLSFIGYNFSRTSFQKGKEKI